MVKESRDNEMFVYPSLQTLNYINFSFYGVKLVFQEAPLLGREAPPQRGSPRRKARPAAPEGLRGPARGARSCVTSGVRAQDSGRGCAVVAAVFALVISFLGSRVAKYAAASWSR